MYLVLRKKGNPQALPRANQKVLLQKYSPTLRKITSGFCDPTRMWDLSLLPQACKPVILVLVRKANPND